MSGCHCSQSWARVQHMARITMISGLVSALLLTSLVVALQFAQPAAASGPALSQAGDASDFAQQVVALTNQERTSRELPPLKSNPLLEQAALGHSQSMAAGSYMSHDDQTNGSTPDQRVSATGYKWTVVGENVAVGQSTPEQVVQSWMQSPGHRANILNPAFREIGVGYAYNGSSTMPCGDITCQHFWTQNFAASDDNYPVVINGEENLTNDPNVNLYIYGAEWAKEMRFSNDNGPFTAWQPFTSTYPWVLRDSDGEHTVTVDLRAGDRIRTASDTIVLQAGTGSQTASVPTTTVAPGPTQAGLPTSVSGGGPTDVRLDRQITNSSLSLGDEVGVTLALTAGDIRCDAQVRRTPADVMLVIDRSSSMLDAVTTLGQSKLDGAKQAAKVFVGQIDLGLDQVGLVQFNESAEIIRPLTNDANSLNAGIDSMTGNDGTNIAAGLSGAFKELTSDRHRQQSIRVIVLLSDGQSIAQAAYDAADRAKGEGVRVVTIGLGLDADQDLLRRLASKQEDFYFAPDTATLADIYSSIAQTIQEFAPLSGIVWTHTFDATNFELIPSSVNPPAQVAGNIITWRFPRADQAPLTMSYRLRSRVSGNFDVSRGDRVAFLRCEQDPAESTLDTGLPVVVQGVAQAGGLPDPLLEAICGGSPWWLLLALLLILLLLILVLLLNVGKLRTRLTKDRQWPRWCELAALLLLAYLLFVLAMLVGTLLTPTVCSAREAIYFTRVDAGGRALVLIKPMEPERPARPVNDVQKTGCPSCHVTVAPNGKYVAVLAEGGNTPISILGERGNLLNIPSITGSFVAWSPDSSKVAYSAGDRDINIFDLSTGQTNPVTGASLAQYVETMPTWSADGSTIAFVRAGSGTAGLQKDVPTDIYVVPAEGGVATILAGAGGNGYNYFPSYSPDGRWLAFTRHVAGSNSTYTDEAAELYVVPADGGQPVRLAANDGPGGQTLERASNSWPAWSPDGRHLAFGSKRNGQFDIYTTTIDAAGNSGEARLLQGAADPNSFDHLPSWGPALNPDLLADLLGLWPWLIPLPFLLLLALLLCRGTEPPAPEPLPEHIVHLDRTVTPIQGYVVKDQNGKVLQRDRFRVELTLRGNPAPCPQGDKRKPLDVALVIDVSSSMNTREQDARFAGTKLDGAKEAARKFLERLDFSRDRVALVPFNGDAQLLLPLSTNPGAIKSLLNSLKGEDGTSLHEGLRIGQEALGANRRFEAERIIVLLSDGQSAKEPAISQANQAKAEGIRMIMVGLGADADRALLQELATQQTDYHFAPGAADLEAIYNSIALDISSPVGPTDITFEHTYDSENFVLDAGSIFPDRPAQFGQQDTTGKIIWRFDRLVGDIKLSYILEPLKGGENQPLEFNIDQRDTIAYRHCGDRAMQRVYEAGLPVRVTELTRSVLPPPRTAPDPLPVEPPEVYWQPDSALIIGVGGTGRRVLTQLKKNLLDAGAGIFPEQVKLVVIDTSEYELINGAQVPVRFAGVEINPDEVVKLDENLDGVIRAMLKDPGAEPELRSWFLNYGGLGEPEKDLARGTHGRRPLARAGLVRDVQKVGSSEGVAQQQDSVGGATQTTEPANSSRVWSLLTEATRHVSSQGGVRIILVGSLAGGMSGTLWDIAYLARRAVLSRYGESVSATLEGYFATNATFNGLPGIDPKRLAANTFASIRELRRFQLNPGLPYPMVYKSRPDEGSSADSHAEILDSSCDWRLFSDVFLFGPHFAALRQPENGTFAAIADILALRLDKASQAAGPGDWYNQMRAQVSQHQIADRDMAVGTAGSYVYRVPAYDIMEIVKLRWVRALLEIFMMGQSGAALRLTNPNLAGDPALHGVTADPTGLVPLFLRGWLRPDQVTQHWHSAAALGALASDEDQTQNFETELNRVHEDDAKLALQQFDAALGYTLKWVLNGTDEVDAVQSRAGKLGYAVRFLEALEAKLDAVNNNLTTLLTQAGQGSERANRLQILQTNREQFAPVVARYKNHLQSVARALSRSISAGGAATEPAGKERRGLFEIIADRATQLETDWRKQMDSIAVRKYLWTLTTGTGNQAQQTEIADLMYKRHASGSASPEHYVDYLWWSLPQQATNENQGVVLTLRVLPERGGKEKYELSSVDDVDAFLEEILALAQSVLRGAWHELWTGDILLDAARDQGLLLTGNSPVASALRERGRPSLSFEAGGAPRRTVLAVADPQLSQAVQTPLRTLLAGPVGQELGELQVITSTDRSSIQLISTVDVLPLTRVHSLLAGSGSALEQYLAFNEHTVTYPEEVQAEQWEAGSRDYDPTRLVLHPLVVAGLLDQDRAICFGLAVAAHLILEQDGGVKMQAPDSQETRDLVAQAPPGVDPLVRAFLNFTLTSQVKADTVAQAICAAVKEPNQSMIQRWRRDWGTRMPADFANPRLYAPDRADLGRLIYRIVGDTLVAIQRRNARRNP